MTRRSQVDAALAALYAQVPPLPDCDGRCWISCGPIDMTARERARITAAGHRITPAAEAHKMSATFWCEALTEDRRCAVYELRPLVCRLWGAVEDMKCPFGCVPDGGWLTAEEGWRLIVEAEQAAGQGLPISTADVAAMFQATRGRLEQLREAGRGGVALRARHALPAGLRRELPEFGCPHCGFMLTDTGGPPRGICGNCRKTVTIPRGDAC